MTTIDIIGWITGVLLGAILLVGIIVAIWVIIQYIKVKEGDTGKSVWFKIGNLYVEIYSEWVTGSEHMIVVKRYRI